MRRVALLVAASLAASLGCAAKTTSPPPPSGDTEEQLVAEDATDANEVESQASAVSASFTLASGSASGVPTAAALTAVAETTATFYLPEKCLTVTKLDTTHVQYDFDACTGPWGIFKVTGTAVATFTDTPMGLEIDVGGTTAGTGATIHFDKAVATYQATAYVTSPGGLARSMSWTGMLTGTTARGRAFDHSASWTTTWTIGDSCVDITGSSEGTVNGRTLDTSVMGFSRCRGECPSAGTVTITNESVSPASAISLTYDGTDIAAFQADGRTYDITLACGL